MQKTIAIDLDAVQCKMCVGLLKCVRLDSEDIDTYDRRRKREARNFCSSQGLWSKIWAKRVISWHEHVIRTCSAPHSYPHNVAVLLKYHDNSWLIQQRSAWVGDNRNSVTAGRTSTRLNIGRPQTRWHEGLEMCVLLCEHRSTAARGSNSLAISTIFWEVATSARAVFSM